MEVPTCPACGSQELEVLHLAKDTGPATLRCAACGHTFRTDVPRERTLQVRVVISAGDTSQRVAVPVPADAQVEIGGELYHEGSRLLVTAIEDRNGKTRRRCAAADAGTVSTKRFDTVTVPISINVGQRTVPREVTVVPEQEFRIGEVLDLPEGPVRIHAIKTTARIQHKGAALARDVVRVYARPPPEEGEEKGLSRGPPSRRSSRA